MNDVLVLNRNYYAIQIVDWKKAVSLMYQGLAEALDDQYVNYNFESWAELSAAMKDSPNGFVNSPRVKIAVPDIIRLNKFDRLPKREVKFSRRNIYQHYGHKCAYCGNKFHSADLNLDHVIPRSRGGKTDWTNIVTACIECNSRKKDRTPEEANMHLLAKPSRPAWKGAMTFIEFPPHMPIRTAWQKVIDSCYWDTELKKEK
jgi:5-methylcytosine-specific restriction endonuclease McrA